MNTNKKPTIAYVMGFMGISGGNRVIYEHANRLADIGFTVLLLHLNDGKDKGWFDINPKLKIYNFYETERWIEDVDIIVATFNETFWNIIDLPKRIKKSYLVQSDERIFYDDKSLGKYLSNATYTFKNIYYHTTANWMQKWLKDEYKIDAPIFHVKINKAAFYPDPDEHFKSNKKIVLVEGNLDAKLKGVEDAVKAIKNIDCEKWLLTSSTSISEENKSLFHRIFSRPKQNELRKIYSSADILVKPSHFESVSLPNMEAMACHCAVISTNCKGVMEYSKHLENSYIVDVGDIKQLTEAVNKLINDEKLLNELKDAGLDLANKNFYDWEGEIEKLAQFFYSIYKKSNDEPFTLSTTTRKILENNYYISTQNLYNRINVLENKIDLFISKIKFMYKPYKALKKLLKISS